MTIIVGLRAGLSGALLSGAASLLLAGCAELATTTSAVKGPLGPAELAHFPVGATWEWLKNGQPVTVKLVSRDGELNAYEASDGCKYKQGDDFLIPETELDNCEGYSGTTQTRPAAQDIWPLAVGNMRPMTTWNVSNGTRYNWSSKRVCAVESTARVSVPAGTFDTYKIACDDDDYLTEYYYAPAAQTAVLKTVTLKAEGGVRSRWELVSPPKVLASARA